MPDQNGLILDTCGGKRWFVGVRKEADNKLYLILSHYLFHESLDHYRWL